MKKPSEIIQNLKNQVLNLYRFGNKTHSNAKPSEGYSVYLYRVEELSEVYLLEENYFEEEKLATAYTGNLLWDMSLSQKLTNYIVACIDHRTGEFIKTSASYSFEYILTIEGVKILSIDEVTKDLDKYFEKKREQHIRKEWFKNNPPHQAIVDSEVPHGTSSVQFIATERD
jgi:hypothetical protein